MYKILDEIKHMDFPVPKHLLNEVLNLKAEQDEEFNPEMMTSRLTHLESLQLPLRGNK